ncbi:phenylalanine--tRNA ligase subunit beta [Fusibacter bizertensis]|uniref:Phenylalanine--tRNA ligase beta subunit n=1 Tax=Fusibacter bizertensis TaxID=1488331 RepID=A0ABT6NAX7_9FIRM|nr:phenylalanine--tRNA ligase subunit beta [Fusibacter bizertensis]MDH8677567.1 phenylalanine--tRNA ligase subunit beta [Fusibacter bizertensis]
MRVPLQWIKEYVDFSNIEERQLIDKLVLTGSNNEGSYNLKDDIENIVVGKITKITSHPNAEKLCICQVDVGNEVLQIVTGATNVFEGAVIPVAIHGAIIAGKIKIKKGKLRGEVSNGMLCSLEEMGFESSNIPKEFDDGILILDREYPLGMNILEALDLDQSVVEFEITPNRPDCLSMVGMAREIAASFDLKAELPKVYVENNASVIDQYASVEIKDSDLCSRYVAKVVTDIKVEPSPMWLQLRLMQAGMRPINNIVDITNYVMLEYGQPIHAFDLDSLSNGIVIVKRAGEGELFETLDGKERILTSEMLVIADEKKTIGIAGVMGGANTEIKETTKKVLIEVASFDKSSIRKTSKELGLRTEASSRFEKGVSNVLPMEVVNRVCYLIEQLKAGVILPGTIDVYPNGEKQVKIPYTVEGINRVIGSELVESQVIEILAKLDIKTEKEEGLTAVVPHYRLDLSKEIDLVEEVARIYGYDKIKMTLPKLNVWGAKTNAQLIKDRVKFELLANGVDEILSYSFVSKKDLDKINVSETSMLRQQVELINPLGEEFSVMRSTMVPNVLEVLARNNNRKNKNVKIFEIGSIFVPKETPVVSLPIEKEAMVVGMIGEHEDFFTLKGIVESVLKGLGITDYYFEKETNHPTYHKGRCANIIWNGHVLGIMGEIHPHVLENYDLSERAYVADLDYNILLQLAREDKKYKAIPKYPAVERDIAVLVSDEITSMQIENIVKETAGHLLESVKMFDMYKGKQITEGYKSVAYELIFRAEDRTLIDEEVNKIFNKVLKALEEKIGAQLR